MSERLRIEGLGGRFHYVSLCLSEAQGCPRPASGIYLMFFLEL